MPSMLKFAESGKINWILSKEDWVTWFNKLTNVICSSSAGTEGEKDISSLRDHIRLELKRAISCFHLLKQYRKQSDSPNLSQIFKGTYIERGNFFLRKDVSWEFIY